MTVGAILEDSGYRELKDYILVYTGLAYYSDKDEDLAARISRRTTARNAVDCSAYLRMLSADAASAAERDRLVGELTIGETYFFRQREHFEFLKHTILPDILQRNLPSRTLRIWSAGCATGAEPYSISILLQNEFQSEIEGWDVRILATDIDVEFLARAQEATFADWALRETPEEIKNQCFLRDGNHWQLRPEYRKDVIFKHHNLAGTTSPALDGLPFDLIICRNVIIYFGREMTRKVIGRFHSRLAEGGWMLVGHAEPNAELFQAFETISDLHVTAYRKRMERDPVPEALTEWTPWVDHVEPAAPKSSSAAQLLCEPQVAKTAQARTLADHGNLAAAARTAEQLIDSDPLNAQAHFTLGLILEQTGMPEKAQAAFRRAIYVDRNFILAHYHLGSSLKSAREKDAARKAFRNVLQLLAGRAGDEPFPQGDGITCDELKELVIMHLERLGA